MRESWISVLVPVRDAENTLDTCLRSVARQSETEFECLVIDDGSRDRSLAIARSFAQSDPRFAVVATPRRGIVAALNEGLERCQGHWVARMDADDWMHSRRLGAQSAALDADPSLAGVGCHVRIFPRRALGVGLRAYEDWLAQIDDADAVRRERFVECPLPHPAWMVRREVLRRYRYREAPWPEDYDLLLRTVGDGLRWGVVTERLLGWREHNSRLWRSDPRYAIAKFQACKAYYLARGPLARTDEYILWGYGETGKALRRELAARGKHPSFIVELHPRRLGECIHGASVVAPGALPGLPRLPLVASVAGIVARREIRAALERCGWIEDRDFWCAA